MSKDQEIRELFKRNGVPLDRDDVWFVRSTSPVVRHQALERLGAAIGILWKSPIIVRAERDEAVVLVAAWLPNQDGSIGPEEWSFGEALIGTNYMVSGKQAAYVYAMAEKRGKDRVILKLAGLQGVYSEEEADDFKERAPEPSKAPEGQLPPPTNDSRSIYVQNSLADIEDFDDAEKLSTWLDQEAELAWPDFGITKHDPDGQKILMACKKRRLELKGPPPKDARRA